MPRDRQAEHGTPESKASTWARVSDELRSQQSLASVTNDPFRGSRLLRGQWDGLTDFVDTVWESVEEFNETRETDAAADAAVSARIDALVGTVPTVEDFQPYLDTFADVWAVYHKNHRRRARRADGLEVKALGSSPANGSSAVASSRDPPEDEEDEDEASAAAREAHFSVPHEFFSANFSLEQHQIFRQSLETSVDKEFEIQSELAGYLDLVEISLFEQIRRAQKDELFDSLASLGEPLQQDLSGALAVIAQLRGQLRAAQEHQLRAAMAVGRLARRKERVQEVLHCLDCLDHVRQCQPSITMLLQGQDYVTALDLMESTMAALDTSLKGVLSIKPTSKRLGELQDSFDRAVELEFVHHSSEAVLQLQPAEEGDSPQAGVRGAHRLRRLCQCLARRRNLRKALNPTLMKILMSQLKKAIKTHAKALLEELNESSASTICDQDPDDDEAAVPEASQATEATQSSSPPAGSSPREGADTKEEAAQKPQAPAGDGGQAAAGISAALCALSFDSFLEFWKRLLAFVANLAESFSRYAALVQETSQELTAESSDSELSAELLRLFEVTISSALKIAGALLQARQAEHQSLKLVDWQKFLGITNGALEQVKSVRDACRVSAPPGDAGIDVQAGLRAIMYNQTKSIIEEFHQKCLLQTKTVLEQERWERVEVPVQYKQILARMLGQECQLPQRSAPKDGQEPGEGAAEEEQSQQPTTERYLHVEGSHFLVVPAVLTLLKLLGDYVQLCLDFGELAAEVVQRMCMLLRLFNQRAQRLVLSGQAVQHQVLKKITAANLALSSQCCGLVGQILPLLRARLDEMTHSSGKGAQAAARGAMVSALLGDLSTIASEYVEHRNALFGKLSDLLRDRYEVHSRKWLSAPHADATGDPEMWQGEAVAAAAQRGELEFGEHEALEGLVKDVTAMYRVLLKNLNYDSVRRIFARAFEDIASRFEKRLTEDMKASTPPYEDRVGRSLGDRLLLDLAYLQRELEQLTGISTPLQRLLCDLVQHVQNSLPRDDPLKMLHSGVLEVLQRAGRLPHP